MTGIGGSAHLENGVVMAAQSGVRDHARVGRDAKVAARAGVTKDIPPGRVVSGFPARDHREELKVQAILHRLPDLVRLLDDLKKQVDKLSEQVKGNGS
jgi:UDP-3-O-[3-hydroxymyristoyl] glucosamine N-acyltransferase